MFQKTEPLVSIIKNPVTNKYTITLQHWDTNEMVDGYTKEEAELLIEQLQQGICHIDNCWERDNSQELFEGLDTNEEVESR